MPKRSRCCGLVAALATLEDGDISGDKTGDSAAKSLTRKAAASDSQPDVLAE